MNLTIPLAALTLMMWIVWSDSVRRRRSAPSMYYFRVVLYIAACGVLGWSLWRDWHRVGLSTTVLTIIAILFGLGGAAYFARQARAR
jgi:hypothetical protein